MKRNIIILIFAVVIIVVISFIVISAVVKNREAKRVSFFSSPRSSPMEEGVLAENQIALEKERSLVNVFKGSRVACLNELGKWDEDQFAEKAFFFVPAPFPPPDDLNNKLVVFYRQLSDLFVSHLFCQAISKDDELFYRKVEYILISNSLLPAGLTIDMLPADSKKEWEKRVGKWLEQLKEIEKLNSPFFKFASMGNRQICPEGRENAQITSWLKEKFYPTDNSTKIRLFNFFDGYCKKINEYSNDKARMESEIYNFDAWPQDSIERNFLYRLNSALAYRFENEAMAEKVCSSLKDGDERKDCSGSLSEIRELIVLSAELGCEKDENKFTNIKILFCEYLNP